MTTAAHSLDRRSALRGIVSIAGAAVVLPAFGSLAGCSGAPASLDGLAPVIRAVAARVIPETDTPGAVSAGVPEYIAAVFDAHLTPEQQSDFVSGLAALNALAENQGNAGFDSASESTQDSILSKLSAASDSTDGKATWMQLRDMVIFGFYTSEAATQELAYEEIPGRYDACLPLSEVGRAWLDRGV